MSPCAPAPRRHCKDAIGGALARALLTVPILLTCAIIAGACLALMRTPLAAMVGSLYGVGPLLLMFVASLMLVPMLLQAWCPPAARAAAEAMQLDLPELAAPGFGLFFWRWLLLGIILLVLGVAGIFIPNPFRWLLLLPAAIAVSGFMVRNALCMHAAGDAPDNIASATFWRRTLLWAPLCYLPDLLVDAASAKLMQQDSFYMLFGGWTAYAAFGIEMLVSLLILAVVLVMWAALALQALPVARAPHAGAAPGRPVATPRPSPARRVAVVPRAFPYKALVGAVVLGLMLAGAIGYTQRMSLLHFFLKLSDPAYAARVDAAGNIGHAQLLKLALEDAACDGNMARITLLLKQGVKPANGRFDSALVCAAGKGHGATVEFLIGKGADVNAPTGTEAMPLTALQVAVDKSDDSMVALLLAQRADTALRHVNAPAMAGMTPLQIAAQRRDLAIIGQLLKAGANPNEPLPAPAIHYFAEATMAPGRDMFIAWDEPLAALAAAGMPLTTLDVQGASLMHWAARRGRMDLIEGLLRRGFEHRQPDQNGLLPFMLLLAWYDVGSETGPQLEPTLTALTAGVADINRKVDIEIVDRSGAKRLLRRWSLAELAAKRPRVHALFGERIDYAALDGYGWSLSRREQAEYWVGALSGAQLRSSHQLMSMLRMKGWDDLVKQAQSKR